MRLQPVQRALHEGGAPDIRDAERIPVLQPPEVAVQRRLAGRVDVLEEAEHLTGIGDRMQGGQDLDGVVLQSALMLGAGVVEPVVSECVGHDVRGDLTVDAVHQEERPAQHRAGVFEPAHRRYRDVGQFADQAHHFVLMIEAVVVEDRHVGLGGRDPGNPALLDWSSAMRPASRQ